MAAMTKVLCWLLVLGCVSTARAADAQDCDATGANRAEPKTIRTTDYPCLEFQLRSTSWPLTEPELGEAISPVQLRFLQRARQAGSGSLMPDRNELAELLQAVQQPEPPDERSRWWKAINAWLDQLKSGDYEAQYRWLRSLLEAVTPSQALARALTYSSLALLVAVSLGLVGLELYHAGWLARFPGAGKRKTQATRSRQPESSASPVPSALAPRQQLAALLDTVIDALAKQQLLPADHSLTHRQLLCAARERSQAILVLQQLVEAAEPVLYGERQASEQLLATARSEADQLLKPRGP